MGKNHCINLTDIEEAQIKVFKKEGTGIMDIFRAGLNQYLNKPILKLEVIKTKEQAEVKVAELTKDSQFNTYGCGCAKAPGKVLCPNHNRM